MSLDLQAAEELAREIRDGHRAFIESKRRAPVSSATNRASELGHPCIRYLHLSRVAGEDAKPPGDALQAIFREGTEVHEPDVKMILSKIGLDVFGSGSSFPPNNYQLSGHVDAKVGRRVGDRETLVGIEIKGLNGSDWERIDERDPATIRDHRQRFIRGWYSQAQLYAFLSDLEAWVFIFKNKWTGEWKVVVTPIDYTHVQGCLGVADLVNMAVEQGRPPDYFHVVGDLSVCRRCRFYGTACNPGESNGPGLMVLGDDYGDLAREIVETEEAAARHRRAWERLRLALGVLADGSDRSFIAGDALVTAKYTKRGMLVEIEELPKGSA